MYLSTVVTSKNKLDIMLKKRRESFMMNRLPYLIMPVTITVDIEIYLLKTLKHNKTYNESLDCL